MGRSSTSDMADTMTRRGNRPTRLRIYVYTSTAHIVLINGNGDESGATLQSYSSRMVALMSLRHQMSLFLPKFHLIVGPNRKKDPEVVCQIGSQSAIKCISSGSTGVL